jgi:hypothetical protein
VAPIQEPRIKNTQLRCDGQASIQKSVAFLDIVDKIRLGSANRLNGEVQMTDESMSADIHAEPGGEAPPKQRRQRSAVAFAYIDLEDVMEVATVIHDHVGSGDCDEHQLSAWLKKSQKSSGFRGLWSTARLFGLIEADNGKFRLSPLGRRAVDPAQARDAKAKAFLTVPLYDAVFEKYKGGVLPPAAALEREMVQIGVAEKQKHTARLVFERSAQCASFFEHGKDRLVMPGAGAHQNDPPPSRRGGGAGGGGPTPPRHPLIEGLFQSLPSEADGWTAEEAVHWLQAAAFNFRYVYRFNETIKVQMENSHGD